MFISRYPLCTYSDGDGITDYEETHWQGYSILKKYADKAGWNESQANQSFSPYIVWHFPAIIEDVKIDEDDGDFWSNTVYFTVHIQLLSPVALSWVGVEYDDSSGHSWSTSVGAGEHWIEHTFSGDKFHVKMMGYSIGVKVKDRDNNWIEWHKDFDGIFSGALHFLEDIWNGIVGAIQAAAKAVEDAVNYIVEWVSNLLKGAFEGMINVIKSMMEGIANSIGQVISDVLGNRNGEKFSYMALRDMIVIEIVKILRIIEIMEPVEEGVMIIDIASVTTEITVTVYTGGIVGLLKGILSKYVDGLVESKLIMTALSFISGFADIVTKLMNGAVDGAISMIAEILGISKDIAEIMESAAHLLLDALMAKGMSKYWWGFALAILGFLVGMVPEMYRWNGTARVLADGFLATMAAVGLWEVFRGKEENWQQGIEAVAPISRETEMVIMYGAFAYALAKLAWDATHTNGGD